MTGYNFVPGTDAQFDPWQSVLVDVVQKNAEVWSIPIDAVTATTELQKKWKDAYSVFMNPETKTSSVVHLKNATRKEYETQLRMFIKSYIT
ncbi:MAG: hypothetical protein LBM07_02445, partial [Culturomica sp.]|nr:hypothetical protein [Culturomica sp.]